METQTFKDELWNEVAFKSLKHVNLWHCCQVWFLKHSRIKKSDGNSPVGVKNVNLPAAAQVAQLAECSDNVELQFNSTNYVTCLICFTFYKDQRPFVVALKFFFFNYLYFFHIVGWFVWFESPPSRKLEVEYAQYGCEYYSPEGLLLDQPMPYLKFNIGVCTECNHVWFIVAAGLKTFKYFGLPQS